MSERRNPSGVDKTVAALIDALLTVEWAGETDRLEGGTEDACPACGAPKRTVHGTYCSLDGALKLAGAR